MTDSLKPTKPLSWWQEYVAGPARLLRNDAIEFAEGAVVDAPPEILLFPFRVLFRTAGVTDSLEDLDPQFSKFINNNWPQDKRFSDTLWIPVLAPALDASAQMVSRAGEVSDVMLKGAWYQTGLPSIVDYFFPGLGMPAPATARERGQLVGADLLVVGGARFSPRSVRAKLSRVTEPVKKGLQDIAKSEDVINARALVTSERGAVGIGKNLGRAQAPKTGIIGRIRVHLTKNPKKLSKLARQGNYDAINKLIELAKIDDHAVNELYTLAVNRPGFAQRIALGLTELTNFNKEAATALVNLLDKMPELKTAVLETLIKEVSDNPSAPSMLCNFAKASPGSAPEIILAFAKARMNDMAVRLFAESVEAHPELLTTIIEASIKEAHVDYHAANFICTLVKKQPSFASQIISAIESAPAETKGTAHYLLRRIAVDLPRQRPRVVQYLTDMAEAYENAVYELGHLAGEAPDLVPEITFTLCRLAAKGSKPAVYALKGLAEGQPSHAPTIFSRLIELSPVNKTATSTLEQFTEKKFMWFEQEHVQKMAEQPEIFSAVLKLLKEKRPDLFKKSSTK